MTVRLTKAQRSALESLMAAERMAQRLGDAGCWLAFIHGPERVVARNLASSGLIEWSERTLLGRITDAGRRALPPHT